MAYIDGFVAAVPNDNKDAYVKMANHAAGIFKDHGALEVVEAWGDDVPEGEVTSFPMAVQCKEGETVVFAWITWPSREVRDAGMKKSMEDPRMDMDMTKMPFDGKRLIFGGFKVIVQQ